MDITYDGVWGYHPLVVSLANTGELLYLVNRSGNRPSAEGAAARFDQARQLCQAAGFRRITLRGDTDFSQTAHLDRWATAGVRFIFGYDAPTCFDPEGTARIIPTLLREGELIAQGVDAAAIRAAIETAFERGELQPPTRPGIAYMLQGDISAINPMTGAVLGRSHPPHLMFYAPGLTNADFGFGPSGIDGLANPPFVYRRNRHHGYVIVTPAR